MQFVAFNARLVVRPTLRVKIKRRLKEAIRLIVTRGAAVEQSSSGPKLVFRVKDVGADKWIAPGACVLFHSTHNLFHGLVRRSRCLFLTYVLDDRLDVYGSANHRDVSYAIYRAT